MNKFLERGKVRVYRERIIHEIYYALGLSRPPFYAMIKNSF